MDLDIVFNKVLLIDGSFVLHRQLSVPNQWDMQTPTGKKTGGVFGSIRSIYKEILKYNYFPIVVFDGGLAFRRLQLYSNYKRNEEKQLLLECNSIEEKTEQEQLDEIFMREYRTQRKDIIGILHDLGIPCIRAENWEGDDLLYILSKMSKDSIIVSDDKDLIQTVYEDENRKCRVWRTMHEEMWDVNTLKEKGLDAKQYINIKAIIGDPSDNIPSACYGVGEKTAGGLLHLYESSQAIGFIFPNNEKDLDYICKGLDIPKRKAYINFDEAQFKKNLELMDLKFVDGDITEDFINALYDEVMMEYNMCDIPMAQSKLSELCINSISADEISKRVNKLKDYLKIEDFEKVKNSSDEVLTHLF